MTIHVASELVYDVRSPATFAFAVAAASTPLQRVEGERLEVTAPSTTTAVDSFGNRMLMAVAGPGPLTVRYEADVVTTSPPVADDVGEAGLAVLPGTVLELLRPSRYCESDRLCRFAAREFGDAEPGHHRVGAICDWVFDHLEYVPGVTDSSTTALDVLAGGAGVCRDYAHLAIALCRASGLPARYVSGYAVGLEPPDFHGFLEVFVGGDWFLFDPTRMAVPGDLVRIGVGRDAADVAFATYVGEATFVSMSVSARRPPSGG